MSFICKNDSKITERPKGVGTYRIVYRHKNSINLYFVKGEGQSHEYFERLSSQIPPKSAENKHLLDMLKNIMEWTVKRK
jgi:hypothetical protein